MRHARAIEKTAKMHLEARHCVRVKAYWTLKPATPLPPPLIFATMGSSERHAAAPLEGKKQGIDEREVATGSMRGNMSCLSNLWLSRASRGLSSSRIYVQRVIQLMFISLVIIDRHSLFFKN